MAQKQKLIVEFKVDENEGNTPCEYTTTRLLQILDSDIAHVCFDCDEDLATLDPNDVARIARKAIIAIGRMGNLFN